MDPRLLSVTQSGSVDDLYSLIKAAPDIVQNADVSPFSHTPLHEASSTGKIGLAMELMILKSSFAKKLNEDGFSSLHLAVEKQQVELALELVKFDPSLVRIRGKGGMTPLHLVAEKGDADLLTGFLIACPESIRDANVNGETALHITVRYNRYEELKVLTGWMQRRRRSDAMSTEYHVVNKCDREGNTALHIAAYENNHEAIKLLLKCMALNLNIQNNNDMTALDVLRANGHQMNIDTQKMIHKKGGQSATFLPKVKTTSVFLREPVSFLQYCSTRIARSRSHMTDGTRNSFLVITALIITATYQTAAQPEDKEGRLKHWSEFLFKFVLLYGFNTISFCAAIVLTFFLLPHGGVYSKWYFYITVPLVCSYGMSLFLKFNTLGPQLLAIFIYVMILFVYLLGCYVRWKRNMR